MAWETDPELAGSVPEEEPAEELPGGENDRSLEEYEEEEI